MIDYLENGPGGQDTEPSTAFDTTDVKIGKVKLTCFDVAGKEKTRYDLSMVTLPETCGSIITMMLMEYYLW